MMFLSASRAAIFVAENCNGFFQVVSLDFKPLEYVLNVHLPHPRLSWILRALRDYINAEDYN